MTPTDYKTEWNYRFQERLGILIDGVRESTPEEKEIARKDADEAILRLKEQEFFK